MEEQSKQKQTPLATQSKPDSSKKNIGMAVVAYFLFFVPLLTDAKNDPYVKFHVKQGLILFIAAVVVSIVNQILPTILQLLIGWILSLALLIFWIMGIVNAATGKEKELPLIGHLASKLNF
ncbi:MAG TPA: hypothetical protein VJB65_03820 [Patescibacteria group bacterium]|nr:hypothetical protein [Patescibacteria group bacterium]